MSGTFFWKKDEHTETQKLVEYGAANSKASIPVSILTQFSRNLSETAVLSFLTNRIAIRFCLKNESRIDYNLENWTRRNRRRWNNDEDEAYIWYSVFLVPSQSIFSTRWVEVNRVEFSRRRGYRRWPRTTTMRRHGRLRAVFFIHTSLARQFIRPRADMHQPRNTHGKMHG